MAKKRDGGRREEESSSHAEATRGESGGNALSRGGDTTELALPNLDLLARAFGVGGGGDRGAELGAASVPGPLEAGMRLGNFRLEKLLGKGGMGEVWAAVDEKLDRRVAIKSLRNSLSSAAKERLRREARTLARLDHPGLCRIYDLLEIERGDFLVLELIVGERLSDLVRRQAKDRQAKDREGIEGERGIEENRAVRLAEGIADALAAAHAEGIIHRDLKPDNVMVTPDDQVKILDFGISRSSPRSGEDTGETDSVASRMLDSSPLEESRLTATGLLIGTPRYMSPEQVLHTSVTQASDLFSFGLVLQEMLTGKPAFTVRDTGELLRRITAGEREAIPEWLAPELGKLVEELTDLDPRRRPSATEACLRLRSILDRPRRRRRRLWMAGFAGLLIVLLASALYSSVEAWRSRQVAEKRAITARQLGEEVQEIETLLRLGHLAPAHDIGRERRIAEAKLKRLEARGQELGAWARGPASYARGRIELALQRPEEARAHLQAAWDDGYREPAVATALGLAFGGLFESALDESTRQPSADLRLLARRRAETEFRDPAVEWLRRGGGEGDSEGDEAGLTEARIALYEENFDEALERIERKAEQAPWLYEIEQLRARALIGQGRAAFVEGQSDKAAELLLAADGALREGAWIARSHGELRRARCALGDERADVAFSRGASIEAIYEEVAPACHEAVELDPSNASNWVTVAQNEVGLAWWRVENQQDPEAWLGRAEKAASRALELRPEDSESYRILGTVATTRTNWAITLGEPAEAFQTRAIELLGRAVELDPERSETHYSLGLARFALAFDRLKAGGEPVTDFEGAIDAFSAARRLAPTAYAPVSMIGSCRGLLGLLDLGRGRVPEENLAASLAAFEEASKLQPSSPIPRTNSAMAARDLATYRWMIGEPVADIVAAGVSGLELVLEDKPDDINALGTLAELELIAARSTLELGDGFDTHIVDSHVERALAQVAEIRRLSPVAGEAPRLATSAHLIAAEARLAAADSPRVALQAARAELEAWMAKNRPGAAVELAAQVELVQASWADSQGESQAKAAAQQGLELILEAIEQRPEVALNWLIRGRLEALIEPSLAPSSFERALELNPWLRRQVEQARVAIGPDPSLGGAR